VLKYGDRASARLIWHDGSVEDIGMDRLRQYVVEQRTAAANDVIRRIKYVEVLQPYEMLKRMWIVDTPGLNAIIPEHIAVTREFVKQADVILWLFRADQAGKKSELEFLKTASGLTSKSIGVLNHIDRVPAAEIPELLEGAREDFADVLSDIVAVSARRALDGKVKQDQRMLDASGFVALERMLSEVFLSQSRVLKRRSTLQKANDIIASVEKIEELTNTDFARQMTLTAEIKALVVAFQDETNKFIAELRREVEKTVLAATQTAASRLVALIQKHGPFLPFADVKYLSGALHREMAPVFKRVADTLDDMARDQTARLKKKWDNLGDLARDQKTSALYAWFETDLEARLRENDMMLEGVSEYLRGRLDSADLWNIAALIPEERVQTISAGELSESLRGHYSFVVDGTIEKSQAWANALYAAMTDLVERLEEELRERHDAERQEVFRPIIRMRPHFVVNAENHQQ